MSLPSLFIGKIWLDMKLWVDIVFPEKCWSTMTVSSSFLIPFWLLILCIKDVHFLFCFPLWRLVGYSLSPNCSEISWRYVLLWIHCAGYGYLEKHFPSRNMSFLSWGNLELFLSVHFCVFSFLGCLLWK